MNKRRFLSLIRQYAQLAVRYNRSYADVVMGVIQSFASDPENISDPLGNFPSSGAWAFDTAIREYGRFDRLFPTETPKAYLEHD